MTKNKKEHAHITKYLYVFIISFHILDYFHMIFYPRGFRTSETPILYFSYIYSTICRASPQLFVYQTTEVSSLSTLLYILLILYLAVIS